MLTPDERRQALAILGQMAFVLQTLCGCKCKEFSGILEGGKLGDPFPPEPPIPDPCDACKNATCKDVPAGKTHVLVCEGGTIKPLAGTADGQYLAWDNVAKTFYLANV